jgi:hypothetical protein
MKKAKADNTVFYIALVVAVLSAIGFFVESNFTALIFFVLATFATYSIKPDRTLALVTGIIVSNLYRVTNGVHEGLTSKKDTEKAKKKTDQDEDTETDGLDKPVDDPIDTKALKKAETKDTTEKFSNNINLDALLEGNGSLDSMMERQTKLMDNLKNMQPMIAQAKSMLNALPKGFVQQALQQFKMKKK